ncbi:glycoside hydrolase family 6 protein [Pseudonocardia sp. TRM90224]|uniref:glycoside hydrolase family 6 protein n=1 Tax=Pseudonocardia sp. TRM90224 TaxID=2812678 RepID=UPI001E48077A|nr:glycoside hydrolase family 6 protein [Pseudonocardia sp. TRM90224]
MAVGLPTLAAALLAAATLAPAGSAPLDCSQVGQPATEQLRSGEAVVLVVRCAPAPARSVSPKPFYVDPTTPAAQQVREWESDGRAGDAAQLRKLADQPQPLWVTADAGSVEAEVAEYVGRAEQAGARPLLVGYNIPDRDCGSYSGGGAGDAESYRQWAAAFAAGLKGSGLKSRDALVVLEPDAIPHQLSGCAGGGEERYALLSDATDALTAAGADVYIDAGHPGFTGDPVATADALERAGVRRAAGFSLNVSNFISTQENIEYGTAISKRLGGAHFVIDTSRNGAADPPESTGGAPEWCNPPGRLLGVPPTTETGNPLVDALLWVKRPGESDGACRDSDPPAGGWFPEYALDLTRG